MVAKNLSWLTGAQVLRLLLGFFLGAWLTRSLGVNQNGVLGTALSVASIISFVAEFGLRQVLIRELAVRPRESALIFGVGFRLLAVFGIAGWGLAAGVIWISEGIGRVPLALIVFSPLLGLCHQAVLSRWDADNQSWRGAKLSIVANLASNAAKALCILWDGGLLGAALAIALETLLVGAFALCFAWRNGWGSDAARWDSALAKSILRLALPNFLSHTGTLLLMRVDQIMIYQMRGEHEAGIYSAATRLSEMVYMAGPVLVLVFMPLLSARFQKEPEAYQALSKTLFGLLSLLGYLVPLGWWIVGQPLVLFLYGEAFLPSVAVLMVHCLSVLPFLHGELRGAMLVVEKRSETGAKMAFAGLGVNIALNLWLIPAHGAVGSAWATFMAYMLVWIGGSLLVPTLRRIGRQQLRSFLAPVLWWGDLQNLRQNWPGKPTLVAA